MSIVSKITSSGILFFFTIVTGIWLSNSGKPLNSLIINIHKLIALGSVIFIVVVIRSLLKNAGSSQVILTLIIVTGLFVLALFVTGALLSLGKPVNNIILTIHAVTPIPAVITIAMIIYLLLSRK
jgi:hypothetical protein